MWISEIGEKMKTISCLTLFFLYSDLLSTQTLMSTYMGPPSSDYDYDDYEDYDYYNYYD